MKWHLISFVILLIGAFVWFCVVQVRDMNRIAKQYAEAKARLDALIWAEAKDCLQRMEDKDETP